MVSSGPQQTSGQPIVIEVSNNKTELFFAPESLLKELDKRTSYLSRPFQAATGQEAPLDGWEVPMATPGTAWDGVVHLLHQPKVKTPWVPSGLRDIAIQCCADLMVPHEIHDLRKVPSGIPLRYAEPIPLWEHQANAVEAIVQSSDGVAVMPPRSGKTRTLFEVCRRVNQPTLWVAPTNAIVRQTIQKAREWFDEADVAELSARPAPEDYSALLGVTTAAAAIRLPPGYMKTRQCLICDEVHHFLADNKWGSSLLKLGEHIYYRYGMTGTFFRSGSDDLSLHAFLSRTLYKIATTELMAKGYLVPTHMCFIPIQKKRIRGAKRLMNGPGSVGLLGIQEHEYRNECAARCAAHLGVTMGRTVLVLVATKAQGNLLRKRIAELCPAAPAGAEFESVEFVSTNRPKKAIGRILDSFVGRGEVKMLIGTSMVGEGVDLPPADSLIYACGGKAAVPLVQGWFRVCTAAGGKFFGIIVDFADLQHKMIAEHSRERWRTGMGEPIFSLTYLDRAEYFTDWASSLAEGP